MTLSHCLYDIWFPKLNLQAIMSGCQSEFCEYMFDVAGIDFTLFLCYKGNTEISSNGAVSKMDGIRKCLSKRRWW